MAIGKKEMDSKSPSDLYNVNPGDYLKDKQGNCFQIYEVYKYLDRNHPSSNLPLVEIRMDGVGGTINPIRTPYVVATKQEYDDYKKAKEKVIQDEIDKLHKATLELYGEEYVDLVKKDSSIKITIWFPEIEIQNSSKMKHLIRDLYMHFHFTIDSTSKNLKFTGMTCCRNTATEWEINSGYVFSHTHANTGYTHLETSFCLGSNTEINKASSLLSYNCTVDNYLSLIALLPAYLSWESQEGGPYISIKNKAITAAAQAPTMSTKHLHEEYINFLKIVLKRNLMSDISCNGFEINEQKLRSIATVILPTECLYKYTYDSLGNYFPASKNPLQQEKQTKVSEERKLALYKRFSTLKNKQICFKSKIIPFTLVEDDGKVLTGKTIETHHPLVFDYIKVTLQKEYQLALSN